MGGGKTGRQTTTTRVELPPSLERASNAAMSAAFQSASLPYSPNRGVTIAGFSPQQMAAMQGTNAAAAAFGLPNAPSPDTYLPQQQMTAGGFSGYSTGSLYDQMVAQSMSLADIEARRRLLLNYSALGQDIAARQGLPTMPIYGGLAPQLMQPNMINSQPNNQPNNSFRDDGGTSRPGSDNGSESHRSPNGGGK